VSQASAKIDTNPCLRFWVEARDAEAGEIAAAEAFAAGAVGLEEREGGEPDAVMLLIYVPVPQAEAVRAAVAAASGVRRVGAAEPCPPVDWARAWREGLAPIVVSEELVVRPSFAAHELRSGQSELVIDPGQAFGTGGHESTRLALELLAALPRSLRAGASALDIGTGSGVLALAALRLGAASVVGFDVDPVAVAVARENALCNGLAGRVCFFAGTLDALVSRRFDLVLANLLKRELLPLLPAISRHVRPGTHVLVSGLLAAEAEEVLAGLAKLGLRRVDSRERRDASGTAWIGLDLTT
jgi:ribosomal protein L11 methyltransferase